MTAVRTLVAGCIGALAFAACAHAADPAGGWRRPMPEPEYERPEPRSRELLSGWYLRGDIGYRWNSGGPSSSTTPITSESFSNVVGGTLGFGYKYQWFRADLTYDWSAPSRVRASTALATSQPQYSASISAQSALVNFYADLGTWSGFTPYVGGGIGVARMTSKNYVDTTDLPSVVVTGPGTSQGFAWAWMAGVAYRISPTWMIDVGFRHLELGDVLGANGAGTTNGAATFRNLSANEARIGVRYLFD